MPHLTAYQICLKNLIVHSKSEEFHFGSATDQWLTFSVSFDLSYQASRSPQGYLHFSLENGEEKEARNGALGLKIIFYLCYV